MSLSTRVLLGLALVAATLAPAPAADARTFQTFYTFTGGADGAWPSGDLVLKDGMLYGTASGGGLSGGGAFGCGTVFELDPSTQTLTTLYTFTCGVDGAFPLGGVVFDGTGVFYGTTVEGGGTSDSGTVFKLDPATKILTTLHTFAGNFQDGGYPRGGLVFRSGMLYGTTGGGGVFTQGTVFALDPSTQKLTTLHSFCTLANCADGESPGAGLVFDTTGLLYSTTDYGGTGKDGTVFQLDPTTQTLTTLHNFADRNRGGVPQAGLVFRNGDLVGTTSVAGVNGAGTVFKLNPATQASSALHAFTGADGSYPLADLVVQSGLLYGTTYYGGRSGRGCSDSGCGTVFKLRSANKTLTVLHSFVGTDGDNPQGGVVFDTTGALYGTTLGGGNFSGVCASGNGNTSGCGTIFKLLP